MGEVGGREEEVGKEQQLLRLPPLPMLASIRTMPNSAAIEEEEEEEEEGKRLMGGRRAGRA